MTKGELKGESTLIYIMFTPKVRQPDNQLCHIGIVTRQLASLKRVIIQITPP